MKRAVIGLLGIALLTVAGFAGVAWRPEIPVTQAESKARFDPSQIAKGAELAMIGNCNSCHTKADGIPYAGGQGLDTPFGTIYSTNITPDRDTGIGAWSQAAFLRAMREGVRRDGAHLYPAFPYEHFTKASDGDLLAIYAFLMTRVPVRAQTPPNAPTLPVFGTHLDCRVEDPVLYAG